MLSSLAGGFRLVAALGFVAPLAVALFGPVVGQTLDGIPRSLGLRVAVIGQSCLIIAGGMIMTVLMRQGAAGSIRSSPLFWLLLAVVMMERLTSAATEVSVERDCIPEFSGRMRQTALANSNMKLRRLDLASEFVGAMGISWALTALGSRHTLLAFVATTCIALPCQLMTICHVSSLLPDQMNLRPVAVAPPATLPPPPATLIRVPTTASRILPKQLLPDDAEPKMGRPQQPQQQQQQSPWHAHPTSAAQLAPGSQAAAGSSAGSTTLRGSALSQHQPGEAGTSAGVPSQNSHGGAGDRDQRISKDAVPDGKQRDQVPGGQFWQQGSTDQIRAPGTHLQHAVAGAVGAAQRLPRVWRSYFSQPILPASLAQIVLYFNAVLSPGALMTAFLSSLGLPNVAAPFRAACATMGFMGTAVGRTAISRLGLLQAGMLATTAQGTLLAAAWLVHRHFLAGGSIQAVSGSAAFLNHPLLGVPLCIWLFCGLVVLSRIAFWTFDMVDTQILQTAVNAKEAASISSTEVSLCCFSEVIMLGIANLLDDPSTFSILVTLSAGAVCIAAALFIFWNVFGNARDVINRSLALQSGTAMSRSVFA